MAISGSYCIATERYYNYIKQAYMWTVLRGEGEDESYYQKDICNNNSYSFLCFYSFCSY